MRGSSAFDALINVLMTVLLVGGGVLAYRWSKRKSDAAALGMPMKWYFFYTFWRLPLSIMGTLAVMVILVSGGEDFALALGCIIVALMQVAVFIGFKNFKAWAINLNIVLLLVESSPAALIARSEFSEEGSELLVATGLALATWFLPNLVYFERRRKLFALKGLVKHS